MIYQHSIINLSITPHRSVNYLSSTSQLPLTSVDYPSLCILVDTHRTTRCFPAPQKAKPLTFPDFPGLRHWHSWNSSSELEQEGLAAGSQLSRALQPCQGSSRGIPWEEPLWEGKRFLQCFIDESLKSTLTPHPGSLRGLGGV